MDEISTDDERSKDAKQFDATMDVLLAVVHRLDTLLADEKRGNHHNQSFHVTGGGWVSIVCACICVCSFIGALGIGWLATWEIGKQTAELHDLHAWRDVHSNEIAAIKAKQQQLEKH